MPLPNFYELLQVHPLADEAVITAAYESVVGRVLLNTPEGREHHRLLTESFETLTDPNARQRYNEELARSPGKIIGNRYRVLSKIAEGRYGNIYLAEHIVTGNKVCIKHCRVVSRANIDVLLEEARILWDLRHAYIPAVRDVIELDDGSIAIIMSYIPGPTLQTAIDKTGSINPYHVSWMMERVLNTLFYLHERGVVHGDLRPANIILEPAKHLLVVVGFSLTVVDTVDGTVSRGHADHYSPPEQIEGLPLMPQSDFYALGRTAIHALNGNDGFKRGTIPQSVPMPIRKFLKRLVNPDARQRPDWEGSPNPFDEFRNIRVECFGESRRDTMQPFPAL